MNDFFYMSSSDRYERTFEVVHSGGKGLVLIYGDLFNKLHIYTVRL